MNTKVRKINKDIAEQIRNKYVQGTKNKEGDRKLYTIDALAREFNVATSSLYKWSQREGWKFQQEKYQKEYLEKLDAQRQEQLIQESKQFDNDALNIAKDLFQKVDTLLNDKKKKITPQFLSLLGNASLNAQKLGKLALGETTDNFKLNAEINETDAFREAMELLDTVADSRRESNDSAIH